MFKIIRLNSLHGYHDWQSKKVYRCLRAPIRHCELCVGHSSLLLFGVETHPKQPIRRIPHAKPIPTTSVCPICEATTYYIQVAKKGNFTTGEQEHFVALYGCRPCFMVIPRDCDQIYGAFAWVDQTDAEKDSPYIVNLIDNFFKFSN